MNKLKRWGLRALVVIGALFLVLGLLIRFSFPSKELDDLPLVNPTTSSKLVITDVNLVDVERGEILFNKDVYVEEGIISSISAANTESRQGYYIVEGQGTYLSPGLIDSHAHIFEPQALSRYLANSVTTVKNMQGMPIHLRWKKAQQQEKIVGSTILTAGPTLNGENNSGPFHQIVTSEQDAERLVREQKQKGYDLIKVYSDLDKTTGSAILKAAKQQNLPVSGHVMYSLSLTEQTEWMQSIEHIEDVYQILMGNKFEQEKLNKIVKILLQSDTAVSTSLVAFQHILRASNEGVAMLEAEPFQTMNPFMFFLGEKTMGDWFVTEDNTWMANKYLAMQKIIKTFDDAGVKLVMGTDTGPALTIPGYSVHEEFKLMAEAGLSNETILKSSTINAASLLTSEIPLGQIKNGYVADLVLLGDNPFKQLSTFKNPIAVIHRGNLYDSKELYELNKVGLSHESFYNTAGGLIEHLFSLE